MDQVSILSVVAIVISVGGTVLSIINHKRIKSNCFGKKLEVSLDVENTTPPPQPSIITQKV